MGVELTLPRQVFTMTKNSTWDFMPLTHKDRPSKIIYVVGIFGYMYGISNILLNGSPHGSCPEISGELNEYYN